MKRYNLLIGALALVMLSCRGGKSNAQSGLLSTVETSKTKAVLLSANETTKAKVVTMYELPAPLKDRPEQILYKTGFTISYNAETKNPNWVAWHLTDAHTNGPHQRKQEIFSEDLSVKSPRATNNDYYNSRYDRGHMCPAGDNKWSSESMRESFLFTNICPQNHGLNKYEWNDLEIFCRSWARQYGSLDIVCGPIYHIPGDGSHKGGRFFFVRPESATMLSHKKEPSPFVRTAPVCEPDPFVRTAPSSAPLKTIGKNKIWVPIAFFKVILCRKGNPKAIGFIYRNEGVKQPMEEAVYTVDEIEALTGIDFFPALDDSLEDKIESQSRLTDW